MRDIVVALLMVLVLIAAPIVLSNTNGIGHGWIENIQIENAQMENGIRKVDGRDGFFVENKGQWDEEIRYTADAPFGRIGIGSDCVYYDVVEVLEPEVTAPALEKMSCKELPGDDMPYNIEVKEQVVKYQFIGSNDVIPVGMGQLSHYSNYFIGNDQSKWASNVKHYEEVVYRDIWDDIDLRYYFSEKGPKYDLILHPGSSIEDIRIKVEGECDIMIKERSLQTFSGKDLLISDSDLVSYYMDDPSEEVNSNFIIGKENEFNFDVDDYDKNRILVIDPVLEDPFRCTYVGGSGDDAYLNGMSMTGLDGNIILYIDTDSTDFPTQPGSIQQDHNGGRDILLATFDPTLSSLICSTYLGGSGNELVESMCLDSDGNVIVGGYTYSGDFPIVNGFQSTLLGNYDAYVAILNPQLTSLEASTFVGGTTLDTINGMAINDEDTLYVTGQTNSDDFPVNSTSNQGGIDAFIMSLPLTLEHYKLSRYIGGSSSDVGYKLDFFENGDIILGGRTNSANFPIVGNAYDNTHNGGYDLFLMSMYPSNFTIKVSTYFGGTSVENCFSIEVDPFGFPVILGSTTSSDFPTTQDALNITHIGNADLCLAKLASNLTILEYSTYLGGSGQEAYGYMTLDLLGNPCISARTASTDVPVTPNAINDTALGGNDLIMMQVDIKCSILLYSSYFGTAGDDWNWNIYCDISGYAYITGVTNSQDLPVSYDAWQTTNRGIYDCFILKIPVSDAREPLSIFSLDLYRDEELTEPLIGSVDLGERIFIKVTGEDVDENMTNIATLNMSFEKFGFNISRYPLWETGKNTGEYVGSYKVPIHALYLDTVTIYTHADHSFSKNIFLDYPFRPSSVDSISTYFDEALSIQREKFDFGDAAFIKLTGTDSNPVRKDKAFLEITSDKNTSLKRFMILHENDFNSGEYTGNITMSTSLEYFENITITSLEDPAKTSVFMVHDPQQIRPIHDVVNAKEDEEYRVKYWNFGYNTAEWSTNVDHIPWLSWDEESQELHGTPDNNHVGPWDVYIEISDGLGNMDSHDFQIIVENTPPEIIGEHVLTAKENEEYSNDYDSTDDGEGDITWTMIGANEFLEIDPDTGTVTGRPLSDHAGIYNISIVVNDGHDGIDISEFTLTVENVNIAPVILNADIKTWKQGEQYYRDYEAYDEDKDTDFTWTLDTNATFLTIDDAEGIIQGTPGPFDVGIFYVNVSVYDSEDAFDFHHFDLTIENVNDKPVWVDVPEDVGVVHGEAYTFDVNATDHDAGSVIEYSIWSDPESGIDIHPTSGVIDWIADISIFDMEPYRLEVAVKASDGELYSTYTFKITVIPTLPPVVTLLKPENGIKTPSTGTELSWEGTDPEGDELTYDIYLYKTEAFVMGMREEALHLDKFTETTLLVTGLECGSTYYWAARPHDGCSYGNCDSGVRSFTVNNCPTIKAIYAQEIHAGKEWRLKVSCSDLDLDDLDKLVYSLDDPPEGMQIDSATGQIIWKPTSSQKGEHSVTVEVTDGVEIATRSFSIDVLEAEEEGLSMYLIIGGGGLLLLIIIILLLLLLLKKKNGEVEEKKEEEVDEEAEKIRKQIEEHHKELEWEHEHYTHHEESVSTISTTAAEAHLHDHDEHEQLDYEMLYGNGEGQEVPEGDDGPEAPDKEDHFLDDMIGHMPKTSSDIETYGQDLRSVEKEMKPVEDPYDHYGEDEEDIEKKV
ncbi:MAG: putative Ig domain-containing protein [Thermoplasmatota archaeon]